VSEQGLDSDLVRMANQIARQSGNLPHDEAAALVAHHLHRFWEPRMLAGLTAHAAASPDDLDPVVLTAVAILTERYGVATTTL
jgi:NADH-dependant formate dehydrogenase delta subunit FdsD.